MNPCPLDGTDQRARHVLAACVEPDGPVDVDGDQARVIDDARHPALCTRSPLVAPHTSPSRRRRTFPFPVRPTRANVDGRRLPAATTKEGPSP